MKNKTKSNVIPFPATLTLGCDIPRASREAQRGTAVLTEQKGDAVIARTNGATITAAPASGAREHHRLAEKLCSEHIEKTPCALCGRLHTFSRVSTAPGINGGYVFIFLPDE